jgi:hypothetical protein
MTAFALSSAQRALAGEVRGLAGASEVQRTVIARELYR